MNLHLGCFLNLTLTTGALDFCCLYILKYSAFQVYYRMKTISTFTNVNSCTLTVKCYLIISNVKILLCVYCFCFFLLNLNLLCSVCHPSPLQITPSALTDAWHHNRPELTDNKATQDKIHQKHLVKRKIIIQQRKNTHIVLKHIALSSVFWNVE